MGFLGRLFGKKDDTKQLIVGNKPLKEGNFGDDAPCKGDRQTGWSFYLLREIHNREIAGNWSSLLRKKDIFPFALTGCRDVFPGHWHESTKSVNRELPKKEWFILMNTGYIRKGRVKNNES